MRKKIHLLAMIATIFLFTECSEKVTSVMDGLENDPEGGRTISLTIAMPDEGPQSRIALEQDEKKISLSWEEGDKIQLSFIQGSTKIKQEITIRDISENGKKAGFDFTIPAEIIAGAFDLYGVYGGNGIDDTNPTLAKLPVSAGNASSLESIQEREDAMLYFAEKELNTAGNLNITTTFKHIGSLFSITVKHIGTHPLEHIGEARLISTQSGWAYNFGPGGGSFDLVNGTFTNTSAAGNYISFSAPKNNLISGDSITFWGWYPPLPDKLWPALSLQLLDNAGNILAASSNSKEARTAPTAAGKSFYFYALWDNNTNNLQFTDYTYNGISIIRLGSQKYTTGIMRYYPDYITDETLPDYEEWLDVYSLLSLKDMKGYSMDYFAGSIENSANIDIKRQGNANNGKRNIAVSPEVWPGSHQTSDGKTIANLLSEGLVTANETKFKWMPDDIDFMNVTSIGDDPTISNLTIEGTDPTGKIIGFKTASSSAIGERRGLMKEIALIPGPRIPGQDGDYDSGIWNVSVYAVRLF